MEVKYLTGKIMGDRAWMLFDLIQSMNAREYAFFKKVIWHSVDDLFLSGDKRDKIMGELNIGRTTYFNRIRDLEKKNILKAMKTKGVYKLADNWMKLVTLDVKVVGAERQSTKANQKLINLKI